ncbi:hypothetical protein NXS19_014439 [Fusarium pseudograminearum]|nr:hypothetical protein NXS19_014439 [Fusarium pseudograminearum]
MMLFSASVILCQLKTCTPHCTPPPSSEKLNLPLQASKLPVSSICIVNSIHSFTMAETQSPKGVVNVGTRKSPLALAQTQIVVDALKQRFPDHDFPIHSMTTTGDRDQNTALYNFGGKGLWTSQLEERLVNRELDIVVHSLKDMPTVLPEGCVLGCVTSREDPRDTLVIKKELQDKHGWKTLADLPAGSIIGTSSVRRIAQLVRRYPTLKFKDHRGNIQTRLRKLEEDPDLTGISWQRQVCSEWTLVTISHNSSSPKTEVSYTLLVRVRWELNAEVMTKRFSGSSRPSKTSKQRWRVRQSELS